MAGEATRTVLFADVSGSTQLYESAGDAPAAKAIAQCIQVLREVTEAAGGEVVKEIGDEVMTTFPSAGRYRLFFQFKHRGQVHTAAFTTEVSR